MDPLLSLALSLVLASPQSAAAGDVAARQADEKRQREAALAALPDGWKSFESGPFLVLSQGQDALARATAEDASVVWEWLDEAFADFAAGTRAPAPILCVHGSEESATADGFVRGGFVFVGDELPRLAFFPAADVQKNVRRRVAEAWFEGHDRDLWFALPGWIRLGLVEVSSDARIKGGKVILKADTYTLGDITAAALEDRLVDLPEFVQQPLPRASAQWLGVDQHFSPSPQAGQLVRYLLAGKGAKGAKTKKILPGYVAALRPRLPALVAKVDAALAGAGLKRGDGTYPEQRALEFEKLEAETLPALFREVFAGWTDKDWSELQRAYWSEKGG